MGEPLTAEAFHDAWVGRGMRCDGTHAIGEALCQNVVAVLATPPPGAGREEQLDFIAQAERIRAEHDATHGEAEMCGGECIVLGLTDDDEAAPGAGREPQFSQNPDVPWRDETMYYPGAGSSPDLRSALLRYGAHHQGVCRATILGPDPRCTCGLSAALAESGPSEPLDEAWQAAEAALPEGWVLDGYRRLYDEGHAAQRWVARAVKPMPDDEQPDDWFLPLVIGNGPTPAAALLALAAALSSESHDPGEERS